MAKFPIKFSKKRQKYYIDNIDYNSESFDSIEDAKKRVKKIKEYLRNQSPYDDGTNGALRYYGGYL